MGANPNPRCFLNAVIALFSLSIPIHFLFNLSDAVKLTPHPQKKSTNRIILNNSRF